MPHLGLQIRANDPKVPATYTNSSKCSARPLLRTPYVLGYGKPTGLGSAQPLPGDATEVKASVVEVLPVVENGFLLPAPLRHATRDIESLLKTRCAEAHNNGLLVESGRSQPNVGRLLASNCRLLPIVA